MRWQARSDLNVPAHGVGTVANAVRLYGGLALLAAMCLLASALILPGTLLLRRQRRRMFARGLISAMFRQYLGAMSAVDGLRLDLTALDALRDGPAVLIAPNHPSMIDAALILSRLPDVTCVMKADILDNLLFGWGARTAGYITNDPPRSMLRAAVQRLREGHHLLLFPEGTRTVQTPLNPVQRTVGIIARHAGVPVQTVIIETNSAFLGKGWPLSRIPAMPMVYKVRLGRCFDPPRDADAFTSELEAYFQSELATARLPVFPIHAGSR